MSFVKMNKRFTLFYLNLINHHYYTYLNVFIAKSEHFYEHVSVGLKLVHYTLTNGAGVPGNYILM